jgi:hypothetical protein
VVFELARRSGRRWFVGLPDAVAGQQRGDVLAGWFAGDPGALPGCASVEQGGDGGDPVAGRAVAGSFAAADGGPGQRGAAPLQVGAVEVGAAGEQQPDQFGPAAVGRGVQRGRPVQAAVHVDPEAEVEHQRGRCGAEVVRGVDEHGLVFG